MKVKTYVVEIPTDRFIVKIRGLEIIINDPKDLDEIIDKFGEQELRRIETEEPPESEA